MCSEWRDIKINVSDNLAGTRGNNCMKGEYDTNSRNRIEQVINQEAMGFPEFILTVWHGIILGFAYTI